MGRKALSITIDELKKILERGEDTHTEYKQNKKHCTYKQAIKDKIITSEFQRENIYITTSLDNKLYWMVMIQTSDSYTFMGYMYDTKTCSRISDKDLKIIKRLTE
jgi:hypothetical protein